MLAPIEWLRDYVEINMDINELSDKMTMTGSKVEEIIKRHNDIKNVVVGRIASIEKHPNADKLVVCKVDIGKEIQIVTGAKNIKVNDLVPVAVDGAFLPGGIYIKKGKLRDLDSEGMLCSGAELGISEEEYPGAEVNGILVLREEYEIGTDICIALKLFDVTVDFEITSNRSDCFGMIGLAREIAVTNGKPLRKPVIEYKPNSDMQFPLFHINVEDRDLCQRYCVKIIKNVTIKESPLWIKRRLLSAGIRSINNIVDITNYVMLEMNQPIHAFDLDKISGNKIIIRNAKPNEIIITLDGQERPLVHDDIVISDEKKPLAIAGIMGGQFSEISRTTTDILIESAVFNSKNIRYTSKRLGLKSEASSRFERGIDIQSTLSAAERVAQLIYITDSGQIDGKTYDICNVPLVPKKIFVSISKINSIIGCNIDSTFMIENLQMLGFGVNYDGKDTLQIEIPLFRNDIEYTADIAEEVLRIYGYDKIPVKMLSGNIGQKFDRILESSIKKIKNVLVGLGLYEVITTSFTSLDVYKKLLINNSEIPNNVIIKNPLGKEQQIMRTSIAPSLLDVISRNYNRGNIQCGIFEINRVFYNNEQSNKELPIEKKMLTIAESGSVIDFYELKSHIELVFELLGLKNHVEYVKTNRISWLHPGRSAEIFINNQSIGIIGECHPLVLNHFVVGTRVVLAEINLDLLLSNINHERKYQSLPKFPSITRDIAIVVDKSIDARSIEKIIAKAGNPILEEITVFDVYEGEQIPDNKKSIAYKLIFRNQDRTLKDDEVSLSFDNILRELKTKFSASLR